MFLTKLFENFFIRLDLPDTSPALFGTYPTLFEKKSVS